MIEQSLLEELENIVPAGERSDFMNEAVEEKLAHIGRKKAYEYIKEFKKAQKKSWSNKEILKFIHEGRK